MGVKGSLVWNYFTKTTDNKAKCNTCGKELASTSGSTSSLARHLKSKHREEFAAYLKAKETREKEKNQGKRKKDDIDGPPKKQARISFATPANDQALQEQFNSALMDHIAENQCPFSQFGTDPFKNMITVANKKIQVPHPSTHSNQGWQLQRPRMSLVRCVTFWLLLNQICCLCVTPLICGPAGPVMLSSASHPTLSTRTGSSTTGHHSSGKCLDIRY